MTLPSDKKGTGLTWLALLAALPILLVACGDGVSDAELAAVQQDLQAQQVRVEGLEAEVQGLQQRLTQGAALVAVLDTIFARFGEDEAPSEEAIL